MKLNLKNLHKTQQSLEGTVLLPISVNLKRDGIIDDETQGRLVIKSY